MRERESSKSRAKEEPKKIFPNETAVVERLSRVYLCTGQGGNLRPSTVWKQVEVIASSLLCSE